ncbi:hypothetical protein chiPu_0002008 [Chiloscyllium punctatum]|uniref:Uncharacterized protein n=1 Tax=Chiloscyllium punctatum TaxID=137246 RepID=A0A401RZQ5_CHIPU|nr:hypothetical protein [Chiloscyllium punctatum]
MGEGICRMGERQTDRRMNPRAGSSRPDCCHLYDLFATETTSVTRPSQELQLRLQLQRYLIKMHLYVRRRKKNAIDIEESSGVPQC